MSGFGWPVLRSSTVAVLVLFLCCAIGVGAWAAEDSAPEMDQIPTDQEEIDADTALPIETAEEAEREASETPDGETPDTFIPSEDISESISVKFPVDI